MLGAGLPCRRTSTTACQHPPPNLAAGPTQRPRPPRLRTTTGAHGRNTTRNRSVCEASNAASYFRAELHPLSLSAFAVCFDPVSSVSLVTLPRVSYWNPLESSRPSIAFRFALFIAWLLRQSAGIFCFHRYLSGAPDPPRAPRRPERRDTRQMPQSTSTIGTLRHVSRC